MKIECTPQEFKQLTELFAQEATQEPETVTISSGQPNPDAIPRIQIYARGDMMEGAKEELDTDLPVDENPVDVPESPQTDPKALQAAVKAKLEELKTEKKAVVAPEAASNEREAPKATEEPKAAKEPEKPAQEPTDDPAKATGKAIRAMIIKASSLSTPAEAIEVVTKTAGIENVKQLKPESGPEVIAALQAFIEAREKSE
jgi:hypothetical protein